jgi:hypothetical protein
MKPDKTVTFEKIASIENLTRAHWNARRGKTYYKAVQEVDANLNGMIEQLHETLMSGQYRTSPYKTELITDSGKERLVYKLPYYPDRIVHWAVMLQMEDVFTSRFDSCTHAAIAGRGIHTALKQVRGYLLNDPEHTKYCLKLDVAKYFPHINHDILKSMLRRIVADERLLALHYEIIDSAPGVPIGNYLSQYYANLYLTGFDAWLKSRNRYYTRYMDDMIVLGGSAAELHKLRREIEWYLERNLRLSLKPNWQIFPVDKCGIDFVGYRIRRNCVILRKSIFRRLRSACLRLLRSARMFGDLTESERCTLASYLGWIVHCTKKVRTDLFERYIAPVLSLLKTNKIIIKPLSEAKA